MFSWGHSRFFILSTLFLFLSFSINGLGVLTTEQFIRNYKSSEALVASQVECRGELYGGQMLNPKASAPAGTCDPQNYTPYMSQYGLQGRIYVLGYVALDNLIGIWKGAYIALAQLGTALLSAVILSLVVVWVRGRFGKTVALTVLVGIALSPMIVGFSRNLYWALPLMFMPMAFTLYYFNPDRLKLDKRSVVFFGALGLLLYIRFLTGYEFVSTFAVLPFALMAYFLYVSGAAAGQYIKAAILVGVVSFVAFGAALMTHVLSINSQTGSTRASIQVIKQRAVERTENADAYLKYAYSGFRGTVNDMYEITNTYTDYESRQMSGSRPVATIVSLLNYSLLPVVVLPVSLNNPLGTIVQSTLVFILVLAYLFRKRKKLRLNKGELRQLEGLFLACGIGLLGYLSWLVLANPHSIVHAHINGILLYLPSAIVGFIILGLVIRKNVPYLLRKLRKI